MTGTEFQSVFCKMLRENGYWALDIPKNKFNAQPFDVIALKGAKVYAVDCKVCLQPRLPLSRIEDNQWIALNDIKDRARVRAGFMCWYDNDIYFVMIEQANWAL